MRTAVFLDRDGVIVENRPDHVKSWVEVEFIPGALEALRRLADSQVAIVVISNQGAVGRGLISFETAWDLQHRIVEEIQKHGGRIDASYICPHHPDDECDCRKPAPGMIRQAARELNLDLSSSWLIGDAVSDLQAALACGMKAILVQTGRGADQQRQKPVESSNSWSVLADLAAAVNYILKQELQEART